MEQHLTLLVSVKLLIYYMQPIRLILGKKSLTGLQAHEGATPSAARSQSTPTSQPSRWVSFRPRARLQHPPDTLLCGEQEQIALMDPPFPPPS